GARPQVPVGTMQAHEPTLGENVKAAVFGGNLGHAINQTMPGLARALGIQGMGKDTGQVVQPEELFQGFGRSAPNAKANPVEDVLTGVGRAAGGLTTGQSLAMMAGAGMLPEWMAGVKGAQFVKSAISAGFTTQMLAALYQHSKQFRAEMDKGDPHEAFQTLGTMGVDGVMAFLAGKHAVESAATPEAPVTTDQHATSGDVARQPLYPKTTPEQEAEAAGKRVTGYTQGGAPVYDTRAGKVEVLPPDKAGAPQPPGTPKQLEPFTPENGPAQEPAWQQTQPIGATDEETGRTVLHASENPELNQARATAEHPVVKESLEQAVAQIPGAKLAGAREEKDPDRLAEKIEGEGQSPETARDYSGFRIAVDSPAARQQVVAALKQQFEVPEESDEFEKGADETGFHGHTLQVRQPGSPVTHEVQILPREVADAAEDNHALYEKARDGDQDAAAQLKTKNQADWQAFQNRNGQAINEGGVLQHGQPDILNPAVQEPAGTQGVVQSRAEGGRGEAVPQQRGPVAGGPAESPELAGAARPDEWNLLPALRQAVAEHGAIQRAGSTVEMHLGQQSMFGGERNPLVDALVRALNDKPNAVRSMFEGYGRDADENRPGQTRMLGNAAAFDAFNHAFGSKLSEQEFHDGLVEAAQTEPSETKQSAGQHQVGADAQGDAGLRAGSDREAGTGRTGGSSPAATATTTELKAPRPAARPETRAWQKGESFLLRDPSGKWVHGTVEYYNRGVNGGKAGGRSRLSDGTKLDEVPRDAQPIQLRRGQPATITNDPVEQEAIREVEQHQGELIGRYMADPRNNKDGILTIATDAAKELFPAFKADPTNNDRSVASAASFINKGVLKNAL
ncbi:MAG TPA: hypothetical protein VGH38_37675, partial [Bryobacteraceae bacterium]